MRLTPEIEKRLANLAAQTGRSAVDYVDEIIERGLEDVEDYHLALAVSERVRKG